MNTAIFLQYHKVTTKFELGGTWTHPSIFKRHVNFVKKKGLSGISRDLLKSLIWNEGAVLFTFDDAYKCVYELAFPVLREAGLNGAIFIVTKYIGSTNDWDLNFGFKFSHVGKSEIRELHENGWIIGSHTHTHPDLLRVSEKKLKEELKVSRQILEDIIGDEVFAIAYPYGRYDERVLESALEAGYTVGFATHKGKAYPGLEHMAIKRRGVYAIDLTIKPKVDYIPLWSEFERGKEFIISKAADIAALLRKVD